MKGLILVLCLVLSSCAHGSWDKDNTMLHVVYTTLLVIDTSQTIYISNHPDDYHERGMYGLFGDHPTNEQVYQYMGTKWLIDTAITHALPPGLSHAWQANGILMHWSCVGNNFQLGIGMEF